MLTDPTPIDPATQPISPAIEVHQLKYRRQAGGPLILDIPQWSVNRGERVFLYGESGAGKSTMLHLLAGILQPESGQIRVKGQDIAQLPTGQRDRFRAQHIGVVFQQFNLIPYLSALDNVLLAARFASKADSGLRERAKGMLEAVNIAPDTATRPARQLSIGQQQRVAIVRSLINAPDILLMDEPTSALDAKNRDAFVSMLLALLDHRPVALVFVSHDRALGRYFRHQVDVAALNLAESAR